MCTQTPARDCLEERHRLALHLRRRRETWRLLRRVDRERDGDRAAGARRPMVKRKKVVGEGVRNDRVSPGVLQAARDEYV